MVVDSTEATGVMDIYAAAGLERPRLDALTPAWMEEAAAPSKAELAIEGLRTDLLKEATRVTGGNEIRRAQFSERINAVMANHTLQVERKHYARSSNIHPDSNEDTWDAFIQSCRTMHIFSGLVPGKPVPVGAHTTGCTDASFPQRRRKAHNNGRLPSLPL